MRYLSLDQVRPPHFSIFRVGKLGEPTVSLSVHYSLTAQGLQLLSGRSRDLGD